MQQSYVDGRWITPSGTEHAEVLNPATERVIGQVRLADPNDVHCAVAAARRALPGWAALSAQQRAAKLAALADRLRASAAEMASLITAEMGAPAGAALSEHVQLPIAVLDSFAQIAAGYEFGSELGNSLILREPVGVVAAITPWNYPLYQLVLKVAPALAAGCTVVAKPSELTPLSTTRFTELIDDVGLPRGVFNFVHGTGEQAGEALTRHPDVSAVSFTGSTCAGRSIAQCAGADIKRLALELGGKSPSVVLPGADVSTAVAATVESCMANSGQTCDAWTRLLVPREQHEEAVRIAAECAYEQEPQLGPLINEGQFERVQGLIHAGVAEGARLVCGGFGRAPGREAGWFARATVFGGVTTAMRIAREEIFGPVLVVQPYETIEEAVELANDTEYGLSAAVWAATHDEALTAAHRIRAGQVYLNGADFNLHAPFGGVKQSGMGRELGRFGLEEFLETKSIQR